MSSSTRSDGGTKEKVVAGVRCDWSPKIASRRRLDHMRVKCLVISMNLFGANRTMQAYLAATLWPARKYMSLAFLVSAFRNMNPNANRHPALQGAFIEHRSALESLPYRSKLEISLVKTLEDLSRCDALIIPGGGK